MFTSNVTIDYQAKTIKARMPSYIHSTAAEWWKSFTLQLDRQGAFGEDDSNLQSFSEVTLAIPNL